jgi:hypothetical protein
LPQMPKRALYRGKVNQYCLESTHAWPTNAKFPIPARRPHCIGFQA